MSAVMMAGRAERMRTPGLCVLLLLLCVCFVSRGQSSPFSADTGQAGRAAAQGAGGGDRQSPVLNPNQTQGGQAGSRDDQWSDGVVPYHIWDGHFSSEEEQGIEDSIAQYQGLTCLRFLRATPAQRAKLRYWEENRCWTWGQGRCVFMFAKNSSTENSTSQNNSTYGSGEASLSFGDVRMLNLQQKCSEKCPEKPVCARSCFVDKNCTCFCREDMKNESCVNRAGEDTCADLVKQGQCENNQTQMLRQCRQACGLCQVTPTPTSRMSVMGRPGIRPPVARPAPMRPTAPAARPALMRPTAPVARPAPMRPTAAQVARPAPMRPTAPVARPAPMRPTAPAARPAPMRPTAPVARPAPMRPTAPVARPAPMRPTAAQVARPMRPTAPVARPAPMRPTASPGARPAPMRPTAAQGARPAPMRPTAAQGARPAPMRPTPAPARAVTAASTNSKAATTTPAPTGNSRRKGRRRKNRGGRRKNRGGRRKNRGGRRKNRGGRRKNKDN